MVGTYKPGSCLIGRLGWPAAFTVEASNAIINGACAHDPRAFPRTLKAGWRGVSEAVLDTRARPKTSQGAICGRTVKTRDGRPQ